MDGDPEDVDREDDISEVPMRRAVACMGVFAVWSVAVATLHAVLPDHVDLISVVVGEVAVTPVMFFLFKDLEIGFGEWKIALRPNRIRAAFAKVDSLKGRVRRDHPILAPAATAPGAPAAITRDALMDAALAEARAAGIAARANLLNNADDDVVFIRLRREIERRIKTIADQYRLGGTVNAPLSRLVKDLVDREIIGSSEAAGLLELIAAGNAQAHGGTVKPRVAELARTQGDRLLRVLDDLAMIPERPLLSQLLTRARAAGKEPLVEQSLVVGNEMFRADLVIPNEVVVEVKMSPKQANEGIGEVLRLSEAFQTPRALLVLGAEPYILFKSLHGGSADSVYGVAWVTESGVFDGTAAARNIAPWLFPTT